ncbi:HD domain-containing protein [Desulfosarcina sp.]|uniref:HD domain-containing protein n=1 Tax=Desulfosarcina sp. TaxID=2027861 RepID=UPI0029AD9E55|nr:HD domain-containing protein [Desulfosarcina sp.]MDX2455672.1 HD domain-containing protein [Desulfosarcina sp.]MDX2493145.1 HD domain-containing protein [Desulfosarcina sp.]
MDLQRLEQQIAFVREVDKLKTIDRQTLLTDASRQENDAEHSWHLALMALVLGEYAGGEAIDLLQVIRMVLVHDLVEIDAGDTYCYDEAGYADKAQRETTAAERIFNLLPPDQAAEIRALWDEFETSRTPEAKFANALDRLQPLMHNVFTNGQMWKKHGIVKSQVIGRNRKIADGAPDLWRFARDMIQKAIDDGHLAP